MGLGGGGGAAEGLWVGWQRLLGNPHASRARRALPAGRSERCLRNVSGPREENTELAGRKHLGQGSEPFSRMAQREKLGTGSLAEGSTCVMGCGLAALGLTVSGVVAAEAGV